MRREVTFLAILLALLALPFATVGEVRGQEGERPPQPFFQDFFAGAVTIEGAPAPAGTQLIACVDDCATWFESQPVELEPGGRFRFLEVNPLNEASIGRTVSFYLVNQYGRIKASETRSFVGIFNFYTKDLTFDDPLPGPAPSPTVTPTPTVTPAPTPTPTAVLPVSGDPKVTAIPSLALIVGTAAMAAGTGLLLLARRRAQ